MAIHACNASVNERTIDNNMMTLGERTNACPIGRRRGTATRAQQCPSILVIGLYCYNDRCHPVIFSLCTSGYPPPRVNQGTQNRSPSSVTKLIARSTETRFNHKTG